MTTLALAGIFGSSFLVGLSGALMPGPVLTVTIAETTRRGFWAGPLIVLGHGLVEFTLFLALVLGLGHILRNQLVFGLVGLMGGMVLVWIGAGMLRHRRKAHVDLRSASAKEGKTVLAGLLTSVANPYFTIWWATVGLSYIAVSQQYGIAGLGSFYSGHIMSDLIWYSAVAGAVTAGRKLITDRAYRWVMGLCGVFLLVLGLFFGTKGLSALL
jgi:threonine/homoserine/homoserine lactone efflux protein